MDEMVSEMPLQQVGARRAAQRLPIMVASSDWDNNDQESEVMEGEEDVGRIPLPSLHPSLHSLGDDAAMDEKRQEMPPSPCPQVTERGWAPQRLRLPRQRTQPNAEKKRKWAFGDK